MKKIICFLFGHKALPVKDYHTNEVVHERCIRCGEKLGLPDYNGSFPNPPRKTMMTSEEYYGRK